MVSVDGHHAYCCLHVGDHTHLFCCYPGDLPTILHGAEEQIIIISPKNSRGILTIPILIFQYFHFELFAECLPLLLTLHGLILHGSPSLYMDPYIFPHNQLIELIGMFPADSKIFTRNVLFAEKYSSSKM